MFTVISAENKKALENENQRLHNENFSLRLQIEELNEKILLLQTQVDALLGHDRW